MWSSKWVNVYGVTGSGKTHLAKILEKKINKLKILKSDQINNETINNLNKFDCLIIDNYQNDIEEKLLYSLLNQNLNFLLLLNYLLKQNYQFVLTGLKDLKSRINSFLPVGIDLPTDDLLHVIITKSFSDRQVHLDPKVSSFIIKNVERSYDKMFDFLKDIDELSLSSGKSININLIKSI